MSDDGRRRRQESNVNKRRNVQQSRGRQISAPKDLFPVVCLWETFTCAPHGGRQ